VGSLPVAVRAAGPLLRDKATDPTVLCVSEDGGTVLAVAGGHLGGGADLAQRCAALLGAGWIPTTSTDRRGLTAPDRWARRHGLSLRGREALPGLLRSLLDQGSLPWWIDPLLAPFSEDPLASPLPLPFGARPVAAPEGARVLVSPRRIPLPEGAIQLVPPLLGAGVGCRRGAKRDALLEALDGALEEAPGGPFLREALGALATLEARPRNRGWRRPPDPGLPLSPLSPETLRAQEGPFSPSAAQRHFHVPGVAEPCAAALGSPLGPRLIRDGVTVALSRIPFPAPREAWRWWEPAPARRSASPRRPGPPWRGRTRWWDTALRGPAAPGLHRGTARGALRHGGGGGSGPSGPDLAERGHRWPWCAAATPSSSAWPPWPSAGGRSGPGAGGAGDHRGPRAGTLLGAPYTNGSASSPSRTTSSPGPRWSAPWRPQRRGNSPRCSTTPCAGTWGRSWRRCAAPSAAGPRRSSAGTWTGRTRRWRPSPWRR
jgi:cobalt-precorrin 5A hydrolase/precorrin-3B C17-methyltransferase